MDFAFTLTGSMPLLMHADDVLKADDLMEWRKDPQNKSISVPGDDRSPAWTWMTYVHHDGAHMAMPSECVMGALRHAGARINLPKGKGTFKSLTQSGLLIRGEFCTLTTKGKQIAVADLFACKEQPFAEHVKHVLKLGIELKVKRAPVGTAKHVRVRPMFRDWQVTGSIGISDPAITPAVLMQFFEIAGKTAGLLDWRPNSKKSPGPYGMFTAAVEPAKARKAV